MMLDGKKIINKFWFAFATVGGIGCVPVAPGTVASVVTAVALWWVPAYPVVWAMATVAAFVVGVIAAGNIARRTGVPDPSWVVIDEVVGMAIALWLLPKSIWWYSVALMLFRFFDIVKPFPVNMAERLPGGWGVMVDDLVAACMVWVVVQALVRLF
jgi:phosphatidylglycerophosphatase A